jgi:hypothetical protein
MTSLIPLKTEVCISSWLTNYCSSRINISAGLAGCAHDQQRSQDLTLYSARLLDIGLSLYLPALKYDATATVALKMTLRLGNLELLVR